MTAIMSSGKSVAAILMAIMVDKGFLNYDEPVVTYWPEFGQNGKDKILVRDVLCHDAGLARLHKKIESSDLLPENIKQNSIGKIIETDTPVWPTGFVRMYHTLSKDWITNEIFRRVEPQHRTMGEYFRQEIAPKYGIDLVIGVKEEDYEKITNF